MPVSPREPRLIRALARDQRPHAAVQAGADNDRLNRPRHVSMRGVGSSGDNTPEVSHDRSRIQLESKLWKAIKDDRTVMLGARGRRGRPQPANDRADPPRRR